MTGQNIFINPERRTLRSGWRVVVFFLMGIAAWVLLTGLLGWVVDRPSGADGRSTLSGRLLVLVPRIAAILIATAVCLRLFDDRKLRSIGYQFHRGWWRDYLNGIGVAAVMMTVIVGIERIAGSVSLSWSQATTGDMAGDLLVTFVFFNVAAAFEELMFRGYPLQTLLRDVRPAAAVFIPSILFGLLHLVNPNPSVLAIINTILAGVWLSVAYLKTRSLWLCTSLHFAWNWVMNSIYGLRVSGVQSVIQDAAPLWQAAQTGPDWLTGGGYGPEGGGLTTVMLGVTTLMLWRARWLTSSQEINYMSGTPRSG
jgi:hypothetical protein